MAEVKDPFWSMMKYYWATFNPNQQSCSFAKEKDISPEDLASLATASMKPYRLEPDDIVIASLPGTDSGKNAPTHKNDTQENEHFLTPPEHHNPSTFSSQEDPLSVRAVKPSVSKVTVRVVAETTAGDGKRMGDEARVDFEKGEKIDSCVEVSGGRCSDSAKGVGGIKGFEREFKRSRVSGTKLDNTISKKIRVSKMRTICIDGTKINKDVNDCEIIDLETEEIDRAGKVYVGKITTDWEVNTESVSEPSAIRGKEKDMGGEENAGRYVKVKKDGSWKDLVHAFDAIFGKLDDGNGKGDILKTAANMGVTFSKPRWSED
ncbi:hypothetical protein M9H77_24712 [Catharanthus roseus]|uniref:Uncharacterized protein n=1 Tax=Catharanthus roseus TaxID=4058 RepID=A0ACC0A6U6_CATRO|nr:hypothetical protein M9H77_24712 [Catharanthus roseus]